MSKKEKIKLISVVAACFIVVLITLIVVFSPKSDDDFTSAPTADTSETKATTEELTTETSTTEEETTEEETTEPETEEISSEETSSETAESTEAQQVSQPEEFIRLMSKYGIDINMVDCRQLVVVESSGNEAVVSFYEKQDSGLWQDTGLTVSGWVGVNGVDEKSQEGDGKTPYGLFSVGEAFYIGEEPETGLNSFQVTENTYWVDDPQSVYYNQKVEGTENKDWNSAEHMISYYQSYKYGFVVNFNMDPIVPGKGSAIFFHCGTAPTAGCVAVPESSVLSYLERLDKNKNPYIMLM